MTSEFPGRDQEWMQTCRRVTRNLMARFQWALVDEETLLAAVVAQLPGDTDLAPAAIKQQIIHIYATMLYESCRQGSDQARRERAYNDLSRFLYRFAYKRLPERAEELVNQTLLVVYERIDECREPGAFLSFAWWKLRAIIKQAYRQEHNLQPLPEHEDAELPASAEEEPETQVLQAERLRLLLDAVRHLLNPREQQVILLTFFGDYSDREIAQRLDLSTANVRVIRHRALARLRQQANSDISPS